MLECYGLVAKLGGLHRNLDQDRARIEAIAIELRRLADDQRQDVIPDSGYRSHMLSQWRQLDLQARRAEDLATGEGRGQEALDAEYQEIVARGLHTNDYDAALMRLAGDPLPGWVRPAPAGTEIGVVTMIAGFMGLVALAVVLGTLTARGRLLTGLLVVIVASLIFKPLGDKILPLFPSVPQKRINPEVRCPGFPAYRLIVDDGLLRLNANIAAADEVTATSLEFHTAIGDTQVFLANLRRLHAPPVSKHVHEELLKVVAGWLTIFEAALSGTLDRADEEQIDRDATRTSSMMRDLDIQCLGKEG